MKLKAVELREEFLTEQAKMALDGGDKELHLIIESIKKAEAQRRMFAKLKNMKNNNISHGLSHILIDNSEGEQITINVRMI
jgi:hypothetical protein